MGINFIGNYWDFVGTSNSYNVPDVLLGEDGATRVGGVVDHYGSSVFINS